MKREITLIGHVELAKGDRVFGRLVSVSKNKTALSEEM